MNATTMVNWQPKTIKWGEWENEFVLTHSCDKDSLRKFTHKRSQWFCFYIRDQKDCQENRMKKWTTACKRVLDDYLLAPHIYSDLYVDNVCRIVGDKETHEFIEIWKEIRKKMQKNNKVKTVFYG